MVEEAEPIVYAEQLNPGGYWVGYGRCDRNSNGELLSLILSEIQILGVQCNVYARVSVQIARFSNHSLCASASISISLRFGRWTPMSNKAPDALTAAKTRNAVWYDPTES